MERIEKYLFHLLVFSIPFQTRVILNLWESSFNEWSAGFLYGTDILLAALFISWLIRRGKFNFGGWADIFLLSFIGLSGLSLLKAPVVGLGLYQLLKLGEFSLLYFYVKSNYKEIFTINSAFITLLISGTLQSLIALIQFFKQSSLGLKILGESVLNIDVYGVAAFKVMGELVLRAYGTFPHPNVLAAFLFTSIYVSYFIYLNDKDNKKHWVLILYGLLLSSFIFSFSRLIIFLWVVGILLRMLFMLFQKPRFKYIKRYGKRLIYLGILTVVISSLIYGFYFDVINSRLGFSTSEEAYVLRVFYNKKSLESFSFIGNGVGNFIPWLRLELPSMPAKNYQPVHNIYLLILTETGVLGLSAFVLFIVFLSINYFTKIPFNRPFHYSFYIILASFLVMGVFDHYFWTLQQGRLLLWLALGLTSALANTE